MESNSTNEFEQNSRRFIQVTDEDVRKIRSELYAGLSAEIASISPKFLYDLRGSLLFEVICTLPEYYLTRTEKQIFDQYAPAIAHVTGTGTTLIDLGAGNCAKAAYLFPYLQPKQYVPIDISIKFLQDAVDALQERFLSIDMIGLGMDFSTKLDLPPVVRQEKRLFFWPGSSISNYSMEGSLQFLKRIRSLCVEDGRADGGLLISADLVKDTAILNAAYNDSLGVSSAFNRNILARLNREFFMNFRLSEWSFRAFFNVEQSRMEMHLKAKSQQIVRLPGGERCFRAGETIHVGNSYKYTIEGFRQLLKLAGFNDVIAWTDPRRWFIVCYARAKAIIQEPAD